MSAMLYLNLCINPALILCLRGKCNMTRKITACLLKGKTLTDFIGKDLKEPLTRAYRPHDILDMDVTLNNGL